MNCTSNKKSSTFETSKKYCDRNSAGVSICLICGQKGYHKIIITSCHSYVTASGTPLTKFLNKIIGEEPCYSISTLICQNCYLLLDRLDTYQARAAEIHHHISTRYKDTKFGFIGNRQRISELIVSSLSNIKSFKNGTTLNVSDELSVTVFHEALPRNEIRNKNSQDRENLMISDSDSSHVHSNLNNNYLNLKRKRMRPLSKITKDDIRKQRSPLASLNKCIDVNGSVDILNSAYLLNNKATENFGNSRVFSNAANECNVEINSTDLNVKKCNENLPLSGDDKMKVKSKNGESSSGSESDEESDCSSASSSGSESKKKKSSSSITSSSSVSSTNSTSSESSSSSSNESTDDEDEKIENSEVNLENVKKENIQSKSDENKNELDKNKDLINDKLQNVELEPQNTITEADQSSPAVIKLEKDDSSDAKNDESNLQKEEIGSMDTNLAEAVLMQNSLATNLLQSFLSTSLWMNSSESSNLNNNLSDQNLNHMKSLQKEGHVEDITVDSLSNAAGSVNEKKRRLELKNTGRSYINTKGKLIEAKRVWPQDCSRCPLKCNGRLSDEKRLLVFADYWNLADYDLQREYLAKHMEREERVGPSGHSRTVVLYFLTHLQKRIQVCRQFFLKTLDVSEKASRIVLEKKLKGELGAAQNATASTETK